MSGIGFIPSVPGAPCSPSTPLRSSPEQKPRPAPVRITARTSRSALIRSNVACSSAISPWLKRVEPLGAVHGDEDDPGFELLGEHQTTSGCLLPVRRRRNRRAARRAACKRRGGAPRRRPARRRRAEPDDDGLDREREAGVEHVVGQVRHASQAERAPSQRSSSAYSVMNASAGDRSSQSAVHEVDPALRVGALGVHQPDVGEHEPADDVADGRGSGARRSASSAARRRAARSPARRAITAPTSPSREPKW